jgi:pSer/pThr/pTyr-binding forkhead associated (FHA) protein
MPHLTLLDTGSGKTHRIDAADALVGRDPACAIVVEGEAAKTVSGRHARFVFVDARWHVEDAGSRNGTWIGTRKLDPGVRQALDVGDVVGLGLTGTQLSVTEAVGRQLAATMVEAAPVPSPALSAGTIPMRRSEAIRAGIRDPGAADDIRVVLRGVQSGAKLTGHGDRVTIGRALECIIRVEGESSTSVSRVHAIISAVNGKPSIRDGGSRHGTFLNGTKLDGASTLDAGDILMLGPGGPTFSIDEVAIRRQGEAASASASRSAHQSEADMQSEGSSSRDSAEFFQSESPTPPVALPAVRSSREKPTDRPAASRPRTSIPRGDRKASRRTTIAAATLAIAVAVGATAIAMDQMRRVEPKPDAASPAITQQADSVESDRQASSLEAAAARVALDSAIGAGATTTSLDSIRAVIVAADRRSAPRTNVR